MDSQKNNHTENEAIDKGDKNEDIEHSSKEELIDEQGSKEEHESEDITDIETLKTYLEIEKEKCKTNMELALRKQAEIDNLRKRTVRDIENAHKFSLEKFVNELLPVVDSMSLGINAIEDTEDSKDLREGMELTFKMLNTAMEKFGVVGILPEGEKFNPEKHEAISMQEIEDKDSGTVVSVMQKGYELNGRLVRPAMVIVAK